MTNNFKDNLIYYRKENHLTQTELAKALNVSCGIISLWENGLREPTLTNIIAIINLFGITFEDLIN